MPSANKKDNPEGIIFCCLDKAWDSNPKGRERKKECSGGAFFSKRVKATEKGAADRQIRFSEYA